LIELKTYTTNRYRAKIVTQAKNIVNEADRIQDIVEQQKGYIGGEFRLALYLL